MKKMTFLDYLISGFFFLASLAALLYLFFFRTAGGEHLFIQAGDKTYYYSLDRSRALTIDGDSGPVFIEIEKDKFRFADSSCKNKICVHQGWVAIEKVPVICLPNKVSAYIVSEKKKKDEVDGVSF